MNDIIDASCRTGFPCVVVALGRIRAQEAGHGPHLRKKRHSRCGFSLCLSRACLDKLIVFSIM